MVTRWFNWINEMITYSEYVREEGRRALKRSRAVYPLQVLHVLKFYCNFQNIVLILTVLGIIATTSFHFLLKANLLERREIPRKTSVDAPAEMNPSNRWMSNEWTRITILLRVAMLYVASRLFITLATVYLPLYIEETEVGGKQALATVPLVSYVSSFAAALLLKYINRCCGTKVIFFVHPSLCSFPLFSLSFLRSSSLMLAIQVSRSF